MSAFSSPRARDQRNGLAEARPSEGWKRVNKFPESKSHAARISFATPRCKHLIQDLRYGARQLLKRPGFTLLAVISMALGIGANTAIFSLVDTVAFRPLPVRNASELQELYGTLHNGADYTLQSYLNYKDYRDRNQVFSGLIAYRISVASLSHNGNNERVWGTMASGNYFDVLGVPPLLGRGFLPEEDQTPKSHPVVVLSYGCWQKRFASDPAIVGRTVLVNNVPFTVVGVARKGFIGTDVAYNPEFWTPMMMSPVIEPGSTWLENRDSDNSFVVGRLKPGITKAQAEASLRALTFEMGKEFPKENAGRGIELIPPGLFIPDIRNGVFAFTAVLGAVGFLVLLLACVNLANLLLARATERRKEIAIRLAVGASRRRLIRQLMTESVMLSLLGGILGVLVAAAINRVVQRVDFPVDISLVFDLRIDWRVLSFTLGLSVLTGMLFSLIPALQSSKPQLVPALKDETSMAGFRRSRLRNTLVVAQVTLSLVLLISAGLIVRSLQEAQRMRPGFNPENAVAFSFDVGLAGLRRNKRARSPETGARANPRSSRGRSSRARGQHPAQPQLQQRDDLPRGTTAHSRGPASARHSQLGQPRLFPNDGDQSCAAAISPTRKRGRKIGWRS